MCLKRSPSTHADRFVWAGALLKLAHTIVNADPASELLCAFHLIALSGVS